MELHLAQQERRRRGDETLDAWAEELLDSVGLTESRLNLGTDNVSPADREKLKGILKRLASKAHPFTQCMRDLEKNHPEWPDDRRKRTCAVLKQLIGKKNGKQSSTAMGLGLSGDGCPLVDGGVVRLLELVDLSKIAEEK